MKGIELHNLRGLCEKFEVDIQEVDSSLSYFENKKHILDVCHIGPSEAEWIGEYERHQAYLKSAEGTGGKVCPRCGVLGSGLHGKWVKNCQGRRYYYRRYFAHSIRKNGGYGVRWCYISEKARA